MSKSRFAKVSLVVVAVCALLAACSVTGGRDPGSTALPTIPELEELDWTGFEVNLVPATYPEAGTEALWNRHLPYEQVVYETTEPRPRQIEQVVATLFRAETEQGAVSFWRERSPLVTYHTPTALMYRSPGERREAAELGGHRVRGTRADERWSAVCYSPLQTNRRDRCTAYLVWVQWCTHVLELDIGTFNLPYRTAEIDRTLREIVGGVRGQTGC